MDSGATRNVQVGFLDKLDSGELLSGTPTVTVSPTGPTISNVGRNTTALTIDGESHAINQAVTYTITGGTAGVEYTYTVTCATDATPAQTLIGKCVVYVI